MNNLENLLSKLLNEPLFTFNAVYSSKKSNAITIALDYANNNRALFHNMQLILTVAWLYNREQRPFSTIALQTDGFVREFLPIRANAESLRIAKFYYDAFQGKRYD